MTARARYNAAMETPENIVVFLPTWVGDVVMATPVLRALRGHFAGSRIAYIGRSVALDVLSGSDWADELIAEAPGAGLSLLRAWRTARKLRERRFDLGLLLPNSFRSAFAAWLGGVRRCVGYARDGRGWLLTDGLTPQRADDGRFEPTPTIRYYIRLAEAVGAACPSGRMELPVTPDGEAAAERLFSETGVEHGRPVVILNPGASFGPSKMWAPERFAAVADELVNRCGAQIIVNAAPTERQIAAEVEEAMLHAPAVSFASRDNSIGLLKSIVRRCDLMITNDTGARHFAAAFGVAVVTLFGSTDPVWAQIDYDRERIVRVDVPCSPCQRKTCPLSGAEHHRCMTAITPEMVMEAVEQLMPEIAK